MKKNNQKGLTKRDLVGIVGKSGKELSRRVSELSGNVGNLSGRVDGLADQIADLATAVAKGFENTASRFGLVEVKQDVDDINLKLDQFAYKFEVKELQTRVTRLEQKTGIKS